MRKRFLRILIMAVLILPVSVHAISGSMAVSCSPSTIAAGETSTCTVSGNVPSPGVLTFDSKITLNDKLTFVKHGESETYFIYKNDWNGEASDILDGNLDGYRADPATGDFNFGTFAVKAANDASGSLNISISNIEYCYDRDCATISNASTSISVTSHSSSSSSSGDSSSSSSGGSSSIPDPVNEPELRSLTVGSGGVLSPSFNKNTFAYMLALQSSDTTKFKITATPEDGYTVSAFNTDSTAAIDLSKDITFSPGNDNSSMSITIRVSGGGEHTDYVVIVNRPLPSSVGEPDLASLTVGGVAVNLKKGQYDYTVRLSKDTLKSYKAVATLVDSKNFEIYNTEDLNSLSGEIEFEIKVIPKDTNAYYGTRTYVIKVLQKDSTTPSSNPSTVRPSGGGEVGSNPQTGGMVMVVVELLLLGSFIASIYFYKKRYEQ